MWVCTVGGEGATCVRDGGAFGLLACWGGGILCKEDWVKPGGRCSGWEVTRCAGAEMPWFPLATPLPPPHSPCGMTAPFLLPICCTGPGVLLALWFIYHISLFDLLWGSTKCVLSLVASSGAICLMGSSAWGLALPYTSSCLSSTCQEKFLPILAALWQLLVQLIWLREHLSLYLNHPFPIQKLWV